MAIRLACLLDLTAGVKTNTDLTPPFYKLRGRAQLAPLDTKPAIRRSPPDGFSVTSSVKALMDVSSQDGTDQ